VKVLQKIETKNYIDMCLTSRVLATVGNTPSISVHWLEEDEPLAESLQDPNMEFRLEESDTVTAVTVSRDSRFLIANTSFK